MISGTLILLKEALSVSMFLIPITSQSVRRNHVIYNISEIMCLIQQSKDQWSTQWYFTNIVTFKWIQKESDNSKFAN